jgi:hypothetical protein
MQSSAVIAVTFSILILTSSLAKWSVVFFTQWMGAPRPVWSATMPVSIMDGAKKSKSIARRQ